MKAGLLEVAHIVIVNKGETFLTRMTHYEI
jgi:hypothetical protein